MINFLCEFCEYVNVVNIGTLSQLKKPPQVRDFFDVSGLFIHSSVCTI
jgi:hypothetical protein